MQLFDKINHRLTITLFQFVLDYLILYHTSWRGQFSFVLKIIGDNTMKRQSHFFQNKIDKKQTVFVSAIYDYDDHTPSFNYGDLALAAEDMIEVTDTTFVCNIHHPATYVH